MWALGAACQWDLRHTGLFNTEVYRVLKAKADQSGLRGDVLPCNVCKMETSAVYNLGSYVGTVSFWLSLDQGAGQAPEVQQHTHRWP